MKVSRMERHGFGVVLVCVGAFGSGLLYENLAGASIQADAVHAADIRKNQIYIRDGLVVGGDRAIDRVVVKDIRRAKNSGFERVVVDLEGSLNGEPAAIQRPPYYQVAVNGEEGRIVVTVWGKPQLAFDAGRVSRAFKRSGLFSSVEIFPKLEEDSWTFSMNLARGSSAEVFELRDPVRIIVDIKAAKRKD